MVALLQPGDVLAGRFRVERAAGEGAMGTVYCGRDLHGGEMVAIKTFRADAAAHAPRFAREAEVLAALRAEGVVRYIAHSADRDPPFLVMEWIEGPTLAEVLHERGLTPLAALQLCHRLAVALDAVHRAGIVHRDLKPGNVMLPGGELAQARIVDFGIARAASGAELTTAHGQLGTPRYMAPEQIRDPRSVDGRSDVFSLGCVLFECLTGAPAFGGDDPITAMARVLFQDASEPSALRPELPEWVDGLAGRLLAKQREQRPDARALAVELRAQLAGASAQLAALPALTARSASAGSAAARDAANAPTAPATHGATVQTPPPLRPSLAAWPARALDLRAQLPASHGPLIGREAELAALTAQLARGAPIALWGSAGMGKTRLALALAERALEHAAVPLDAALFVDLSGARDTADAVRLVAERARLLPGASDHPEALLGALLAKLGRVLLVLDRVEPLAGQIEPLIRLWTMAAPRLQVILTSRIRPRFAHAFELRPLSTAPATVADGVQTLSPAATLLHARVREALPELPDAPALAPSVASALERIAASLDGIPLALELAAARANVLGLDGVLARLSAPLELLGASERAGDPHAITMRGALAWSWDSSSEAERWACMQCALFSGGFELTAAQAVVALPAGAPPPPALLQALREQSLLRSEPAPGDPLALRFTMFAAVRDFALEQWTLAAASSPELASAPLRHAAYFAARAGELMAEAHAGGAGPARARLARFRASERANLTAAIERALGASPPDPLAALRLLHALEPELLAGGPRGELASLLERALSAAETAVFADREPSQGAPVPAPASASIARLDRDELAVELAAAHQLHARLLVPAGRLERARGELEAALASARQLKHGPLQAGIWLDLGVAQHFARELDAARASYETALALLQEHDDVVSEARCLGNLAAIAHDRCELSSALAGYRRAIALLEDADEPRLLANFCGNQALCEHELQQTAAARASYQRAIALLEPLGDARLLGIVLSNFATLELAEGTPGSALPLHERACLLLRDAGDARSDGLARGRYAAALALDGRAGEAERACAQAERMLRRDPLASAVIALLRAFLELAHARAALAGGALARARAELAAASGRAEQAQRSDLDGRRLYDQCDDVRVYLSLLRPELERLRGELAGRG